MSSMRLESGHYDDAASILFNTLREIERARDAEDDLKAAEEFAFKLGIYIFTYIDMCVHLYIHVFMSIYMYIYIYVCIYKRC
jgi:dolichyl-phosphate-mannose--protein O-mannosyl transferase